MDIDLYNEICEIEDRLFNIVCENRRLLKDSKIEEAWLNLYDWVFENKGTE